jgi:hypothetical protein
MLVFSPRPSSRLTRNTHTAIFDSQDGLGTAIGEKHVDTSERQRYPKLVRKTHPLIVYFNALPCFVSSTKDHLMKLTDQIEYDLLLQGLNSSLGQGKEHTQ